MIELENHYDVNRWMGVRTASLSGALTDITSSVVGGFSMQTVLLVGIVGMMLYGWAGIKTREYKQKRKAKKIARLRSELKALG